MTPLSELKRKSSHFISNLAEAASRLALLLLGLAVALLAGAAITKALKGDLPGWLGTSAILDNDLLTALGSLLLGLSGLYIGSRLRKYQELEAKARANLALNVELRARAVPAERDQILEVIIEVHNVSRTTWFVPMAYLFVRGANGAEKDIPLLRVHRNLADYGATLCQLQPDERDQFFMARTFTPEEVAESPAVVVKAEIVGTAEKWLGPHKASMDFISFMEEREGARHNFHCIERCKDKKHEWHGLRVFINEDGTIDGTATRRYRGLLDDMMLWSRGVVVALALPATWANPVVPGQGVGCEGDEESSGTSGM